MMPKLNLQHHLQKHPKNVRKATVLAFVLNGSKIISTGYNRKRFSSNGKFTTHAEDSALSKAGRRAKGQTLYVIRLLKDGSIGMALPCKDCQKLIEKYEVKKVYYSQ